MKSHDWRMAGGSCSNCLMGTTACATHIAAWLDSWMQRVLLVEGEFVMG